MNLIATPIKGTHAAYPYNTAGTWYLVYISPLEEHSDFEICSLSLVHANDDGFEGIEYSTIILDSGDPASTMLHNWAFYIKLSTDNLVSAESNDRGATRRRCDDDSSFIGYVGP